MSRRGWCYCGKDEAFDNMIGCDNKVCKIQWYHLSCLKLDKDKIPKGKFDCPDCHKGKRRAASNVVYKIVTFVMLPVFHSCNIRLMYNIITQKYIN